MILGIEKELVVFLQSILAGNTVWLVYSAIRVLRRIIKHSLVWISIEDLLFWIGTGFYLFYQIHRASNGVIRWYFVIGVLIGGILTYCIVDKILKKYIAQSKEQ